MDAKVTYECPICGVTKDVDETAPPPRCEECEVEMELAGGAEEEEEEEEEELKEDLWDEEEE